MKKKKISILGSTGTIGLNALSVIRNNKEMYEVFAISGNKNVKEIIKQIDEFNPKFAVICDLEAYNAVKLSVNGNVNLMYGEKGLDFIASNDEVDFVLAGIVGAAGLSPFLAALNSEKTIGLANKEVLVMLGEYLHKNHSEKFLKQIIPVDSEHSAIFQCLQGSNKKEIESIILTASGGPFRDRMDLSSVKVSEALNHPNWCMGNKITIDSATLMNKGLELIEAYWLFPVKIEQIQVIIHPQSIIHSMVSFIDGAILAHLGIADMKIPIQYALSYPERINNNLKRLDFTTLKELTFKTPDIERFPCLNLAVRALKKGQFAPILLNAANEISVANFLNEKISFQDIARCNEYVLETCNIKENFTLENIIETDKRAREVATKWIQAHSL